MPRNRVFPSHQKFFEHPIFDPEFEVNSREMVDFLQYKFSFLERFSSNRAAMNFHELSLEIFYYEIREISRLSQRMLKNHSVQFQSIDPLKFYDFEKSPVKNFPIRMQDQKISRQIDFANRGADQLFDELLPNL